MTILDEGTPSKGYCKTLSQRFAQLRLEEPSYQTKEREIKLKYLSGDVSLNLMKTSKMTIERLREEMTEVRISAMGKSLLPLMS